jgi:hypothetical protein
MSSSSSTVLATVDVMHPSRSAVAEQVVQVVEGIGHASARRTPPVSRSGSPS